MSAGKFPLRSYSVFFKPTIIKTPGRIAVIGGTPFDAQLGKAFLEERQIESTAIGISSSPPETAALYHHPRKLAQRFEEKVQPQNYQHLIIYCNSLSFAGSWSQRYPGKVWELKSAYQQIIPRLDAQPALALTAEVQLKNKLEALAHRLKPEGKLQVEARLDWVQELERLSPAEQVKTTRQYLRDFYAQGYATVILACTHFENEVFAELEQPRVLQPGLAMLERFVATQG